jgi:tetratricopeptide (TPR) repeat protein
MAEKSFVRALEEANDFALAYYNLGVVYTELGQEEAAEVAFSKAIENNSELNAAYYALGFNLFTRAEARLEDLETIFVEPPGFEPPHEPSCKELFWRPGQIFDSAKKSGMDQDDIDHQKESLNNYYSYVVRLCDQAIHVAKSKSSFEDRDFNVLAEAYNLKANAQVRRHMLESGDRKDKKPDYLESAKEAVKYSWKAIFKAEFDDEMILKCKKTFRECSIDFADLCLYSFYKYSTDKYIFAGCFYYEKYEKYPGIDYVYNAETALKQAQFVDPTDANIYFILGKQYYCIGDFAKSAEAYENAAQAAPDNCDFWAHLALAYARDDNRTRALSACENVKVYERGASYQAIEIATLAHRVLVENIDEQLKKKPVTENEKRKLQDEMKGLEEDKLKLEESCRSKMRASLLAKMDLYLRDDGRSDAREILYKIYCIKSKLDSAELESCKSYDRWTYAQFALTLALLWNKLKEKDRHLLKEEGPKAYLLPHSSVCDDKYVDGILQEGIKCLEQKSDPNECEWMWLNGPMFMLGINYSVPKELVETRLNEQNTLALGCLYYCKSSRSDQNKCEDSAFSHFHDVKEYIKQELSKNYHGSYSLEESYILIKLGQIYLKAEKFEEAEDCFKNALQMLEIDHPQMVMREQLRLQLAEAFREQKKKSSALKEARKSQICNPVNERLGEVTGDIYCDLEKYRIALEEYYGALVWEPDDPEILIKIGKCYLERAAVCRKTVDRERSLKNANLHFEHAWELYDKDNLKKRTEARYLMAKTYMELCDYDGALPHLKVIYNSMRSKKGITPKVLIVGITLGQTYLKTKYYNKCEEIFSEVIEKGKTYMNDPKNKSQEFDDFEEYSVDKMSLDGIMARAYIGLASSFAERNTKICLDRALKEVQESDGYINLLKSWDEKTRCQAMSTDCEGWIRYKQHQICDKKMSTTINLECKELIELSIERLESSVSTRAESSAYLHLALAYKARSEIKTEPERNNLLQRAKGCWKLARDLDIKGEYDEELKDLEKDLGI